MALKSFIGSTTDIFLPALSMMYCGCTVSISKLFY
jgi:hypothetical protein